MKLRLKIRYETLEKHKEHFLLAAKKRHSPLYKKIALFFKTVFFAFFAVIMVISFISFVLSNNIQDIVVNPKLIPIQESLDSNASYSLIRTITGRNVFNITGQIPFEDTEEGSEAFLLKNFTQVACAVDDKLPVDVLGIIYTGNPKTNLVTVKDSLVNNADVYHEGEVLIDNTNYSVFNIESSSKVQFRHGRKKICVTLIEKVAMVDVKEADTENSSSIETEYSLDSDFVSQELGAGFSKILRSARLSPKIMNGKSTGFQVFDIEKGSLFDKIKLENGDVLTNVNGTALQDPSQGFRVYESFQGSDSVVLQFTRNGVPMTKTIDIDD